VTPAKRARRSDYPELCGTVDIPAYVDADPLLGCLALERIADDMRAAAASEGREIVYPSLRMREERAPKRAPNCTLVHIRTQTAPARGGGYEMRQGSRARVERFNGCACGYIPSLVDHSPNCSRRGPQ
jgi:hypothetical protein